MENNTVSFRSKAPRFHILLHELGHCYFKEPDPIWSAVYGGGEELLWLILKDCVEGDEESIRRWHNLMHMALEEKKEKLMKHLDEIAINIYTKYGIDVVNSAKQVSLVLQNPELERPIYGYMYYAGVLPSPELMPQSLLVNLLEGIRYRDSFMALFFQELMNKTP